MAKNQTVEPSDDDEIKDDGADEQAAKPTPRGRQAGAAKATPVSVATAETEIDITEHWEERALETKKALDAQPKVRIMIPLQNGEQPGSVQEFNINGYRIAVRKNVMVDVPEQIAQMIAERYQIETTAGANMRLDRAKPGLNEALS